MSGEVSHFSSPGCWDTTNRGEATNSQPQQTTEVSQTVMDMDDGHSSYVHARAKRGDSKPPIATAWVREARRERIGERMKILEELLIPGPGGNKDITGRGKAVMLDEVISYVQSLQQQVEFLSMTLACAATKTG
ncbi:hypothetical protein M569_00422 [Genlisea aurea]|uniref:BHLH domain-containing protein n=1 Tax=Genlisea aurea TaxID=192259 RepID=S8DA32_9LAMI|nr:hypothetical protein M569_00422 [Genlisea aurea]